MAKDDYFVIVYQILKYLYDCLKEDRRIDFTVISYESFDIPFNYWCYILENLQKQGLLAGLSIVETKDGKLIQNSSKTRITPDGIAYLFENSMLEKVKRTLKDVKDIIPFIG